MFVVLGVVQLLLAAATLYVGASQYFREEPRSGTVGISNNNNGFKTAFLILTIAVGLFFGSNGVNCIYNRVEFGQSMDKIGAYLDRQLNK